MNEHTIENIRANIANYLESKDHNFGANVLSQDLDGLIYLSNHDIIYEGNSWEADIGVAEFKLICHAELRIEHYAKVIPVLDGLDIIPILEYHYNKILPAI